MAEDYVFTTIKCSTTQGTIDIYIYIYSVNSHLCIYAYQFVAATMIVVHLLIYRNIYVKYNTKFVFTKILI